MTFAERLTVWFLAFVWGVVLFWFAGSVWFFALPVLGLSVFAWRRERHD